MHGVERSMARNTQAIGILDSGVGGLSILCELQQKFPKEHFIYLGDTLHAPYGSRNEQDIRGLIDNAIAILSRHQPKALVLGSSTITTVALDHLRARHTTPIVGTYPAVDFAVRATRSRVIGVLSTRATARGELLESLVSLFAKPAGVRVMKAWHDDLVPLIEHGQVDTPALRALLHETLDPLARGGVDQLVLASTHFTFLRPVITAEFGNAFGFADSAGSVATEMACLLDRQDLRNSGAGMGSTLYLFTGAIDQARTTLVALLNLAMPDKLVHTAALDVRSAMAAEL
jgi:glutamate racemase